VSRQYAVPHSTLFEAGISAMVSSANNNRPVGTNLCNDQMCRKIPTQDVRPALGFDKSEPIGFSRGLEDENKPRQELSDLYSVLHRRSSVRLSRLGSTCVWTVQRLRPYSR
jgi:hypothetical protein